MGVNPLRHMDVFSPEAFGNKRVDVVGVGATGSRVVLEMARLGLENIHPWDPDTVADINVPNQVYGEGDIGRRKVDALFDIVKRVTGTELIIHPEEVDGSQTFGEIVFLLPDRMDTRETIWKAGIKYKSQIRRMIETRLGAEQGRIYSIDPRKPAQIRGWESTLCSDDDVEEQSPCGGSISVGPTAKIIAGIAVWQLMRWFNLKEGNVEDVLDHEIMFHTRPMILTSRRFE